MTGASWEGFVIDQIAAHMPTGASLSFDRTAAGAERDVVVETGQRKIGFEIKFSVALVQQRWPFAEGVEVISVGDIAGVLTGSKHSTAFPDSIQSCVTHS